MARGDRRGPLGTVRAQVVRAQETAGRRDGVGDPPGELAAVELGGARVGDPAQRRGELGPAHDGAGGHGRPAASRNHARNTGSAATASRSAAIQPAIRGLMSIPPPRARSAGGARASARGSDPKRVSASSHAPTVPGTETDSGRGRGPRPGRVRRTPPGSPSPGAPPVPFRQCVAGARLVVEEEQIAAEPAHVRVDDGEHGIRRDRRVEGVAARREHLLAGLGRGVVRAATAPARSAGVFGVARSVISGEGAALTERRED